MPSKNSLQVFVSSTEEDLRLHRVAAQDVIARLGWQARVSNVSTRTTVDACRRWIREADLVLLIVAFRRGWVPSVERDGDGASSITAIEFQEANRHCIPVVPFLANEKSWPLYLCEIPALDWLSEFRDKLDQPYELFDHERDEGLPEFRYKIKGALLEHKEKILSLGHGNIVIGNSLLRLHRIFREVVMPAEYIHLLFERWAPPRTRLQPDREPLSLLEQASEDLAQIQGGTFPLLKFVEDLQHAVPKSVATMLGEWLGWATPQFIAKIPEILLRENLWLASSPPTSRPSLFTPSESTPIKTSRNNAAAGIKATLHALLIGIDGYLPNRMPNGGSFPALDGCVRDVEATEKFLFEECCVSLERVTKLTATVAAVEPIERWPTYENIVRAFEDLSHAVSPGDHVLVHYSGHGTRLNTVFPEQKGVAGFDTALVPCDIGESLGRFLRDIELAVLVKRLVDRGCRLTLILDCSHAGGFMTDAIGLMGEGYYLPLEACVVIAACLPSEAAFDGQFGEERRGVLSYFFLESLRRIGVAASCKELFERTFAQIRAEYPHQTPMLGGDVGRPPFGGPTIDINSAVTLLRFDKAQNLVLLSTGESQSIRRGAQFSIFPASGDVGGPGRCQGVVEVRSQGTTESWAEIIQLMAPSEIEPGAQAVLRRLSPFNGLDRVRLVTRRNGTSAAQKSALLRLGTLVEATGLLNIASTRDSAFLQVAINDSEEFEILDTHGQPIPNVGGHFSIADPESCFKIARRLTHLIRYMSVQGIKDPGRDSVLADKITMEVVRPPANWDYSQRALLESTEIARELEVGKCVGVKVANYSSLTVNLVVLVLRHDWAITQIFPRRNLSAYYPLGPGEMRVAFFSGDLPDGLSEGSSELKLFGTLGNADFGWLELAPLDESEPLSQRLQTSELLSAQGAFRSAKMLAAPVSKGKFSPEEWITTKVTLLIHRNPQDRTSSRLR